ncbi:heterokaryon incompatibility protein-domain-containing protein [Apiospora phragmitis]|uniref:Heterokaryon incompatibility protein-domain-containing protein n=1 Tax=Apiospora phragmitis TaxID=2905665 RepID=A0ABR1U6V1_9PEZI
MRDGPGAKTTTYRYPSWSWASQDSSVRYLLPKALGTGSGELAYDCEVLDAEVKAGKHNVFGSVESGFVRLKASLISAWTWRDAQWFDNQCLVFWDDTRLIVIPAIMDDEQWVPGQVVCAFNGTQRILILQPVVLASSNYKRIGIGTWNREDHGGYSGWAGEPSKLNIYGTEKEPRYNILTYTWGRFQSSQPGNSIVVHGIDWYTPPILPSHFTVGELQNVLMKFGLVHGSGWVWVDVACIDQRDGSEMKKIEIGRQAAIFANVDRVFSWWTTMYVDQLQSSLDCIKFLDLSSHGRREIAEGRRLWIDEALQSLRMVFNDH